MNTKDKSDPIEVKLEAKPNGDIEWKLYQQSGERISNVENRLSHHEDKQGEIDNHFEQKQKKHNSDPDKKFVMFNGKVLIASLNEDGSLTVKPCRYSDYLAYQDGVLTTPIKLSGTACVLVTSDHQIIIGSRDISKDKKDPTKYPIQFPCGFHDSNEEQVMELKSLRNAKYPFSHFASHEGKRELNEEVIHFSQDQIKECEPLGFSTWTNKNNGVEMLATHFSLYHTSLTFDEICKIRENNPPKDLWEMSMIQGLPLSELVSVIDNGKYFFDKENRLFAGDLGFGPKLVCEKMIDHCTSNLQKDHKTLNGYGNGKGKLQEKSKSHKYPYNQLSRCTSSQIVR